GAPVGPGPTCQPSDPCHTRDGGRRTTIRVRSGHLASRPDAAFVTAARRAFSLTSLSLSVMPAIRRSRALLAASPRRDWPGDHRWTRCAPMLRAIGPGPRLLILPDLASALGGMRKRQAGGSGRWAQYLDVAPWARGSCQPPVTGEQGHLQRLRERDV